MHPRQHEVLVVRHAHFTRAELLAQLGHCIQLIGRGVTRVLAQALERQGHSAQSGVLMGMNITGQPAAVGGVF